MIDPRRLSLLKELERLGTLTRVAESRFLSTSGVSQQLAVLEQEAGVPLLERHGRRIRLTEEGALLVRHGRSILASIEAAETDLQSSKTVVAGNVRIGAFSSTARALLPAAVSSLARNYPALDVSVEESGSHDNLQRLELGDLDIAVVESFATEPVVGETLAAELLVTDPLLAVLPPDHPLAKQRSIRIEQLAGERWLMEAANTYLGGFVQRACAEAGFRPAVAGRFQHADVALAFVAAGLGVTVLPELVAARSAASSAQVPLAPPVERRILAVVRQSNQARPSVRATIAALHEAVLSRRL